MRCLLQFPQGLKEFIIKNSELENEEIHITSTWINLPIISYIRHIPPPTPNNTPTPTLLLSLP